MLTNDLEKIGLAELQQLVTDAAPEGKTIEYKRDFYCLDGPASDFKTKQHEEMLKDISSFAQYVRRGPHHRDRGHGREADDRLRLRCARRQCR